MNSPIILPNGIKPYYHDEESGITIYNADCREILPYLPKVDLVLTDPPYGLGELWQGGGGGEKSSWGFKPSEAMAWDMIAPEWVAELPALAEEAIIWGGNYFVLPPSRRWLIWDKKQPDTWTTGQAEMAWTNLDGTVRVFRYAQCELANDEDKKHPTQKPLKLIQWCLKWSKTTGLILDPFMGSGTTLVAAKNLGRRAIGIEIEPKYCEIAVQRLAQKVMDFGEAA